MTINYNQNIPNPPNDPADDVSTMQSNAQAIAQYVGVDHRAFNFTASGTHNQVTFQLNQTAPALPANTVSELFANTSAGQSWPFWFNAIGTAYQILGAPTASATNGSVLIPGGIILKWGFTNSTTTGSFTSHAATGSVTFATAFPNNCYIVGTQLTYNTNLPGDFGTISVQNKAPTSPTTGGFNWSYVANTSQNTGMFWWAIGN